MSNSPDLRLGYLTVHKVEESVFRAGVLITTAETFPIEFRVTNPIKPTKMQTLLYGDRLGEYIAIETGKALIGSLKQKPDHLLTDIRHLLPIRPYIGMPILYVQLEEDSTDLKIGLHIEGHSEFSGEAEAFRAKIPELTKHLLDPFERAKAAIEEVQKMKLEETQRRV